MYEARGAARTLADDESFELTLIVGSFKNRRLHSIVGDESKDEDGFRLTDSMRSIHRLQVDLRVPMQGVHDQQSGSKQ